MTTRYPIILVHGILMKQKWFRAFEYIQKSLTEEGYHIYIADTDGVGTIETNAAQLKKQIEDILEKEGVDKINVVAHSKGGLDAIHMIEHLDMEEKVASLTTLCTPHKGSQVATKIVHLPSFFLNFLGFWFNTFYKFLKDEKPDAIMACRQLESKLEITATPLLNERKIYCQSYSSVMHKASSDFTLGIPFLISRHFENDDSDGMVSKTSAVFGTYKGNVMEESLSHNEVVCYMTRKKKKKKVVAFYKTMLTDLAERGF